MNKVRQPILLSLLLITLLAGVLFYQKTVSPLSGKSDRELVKQNSPMALATATNPLQTPVLPAQSMKKTPSKSVHSRNTGSIERNKWEEEDEKIPKAEKIKEAIEENRKRTMDLSLGYVPTERLITAIDQTRRRQAELMASGFYTRGDLTSARWRERGPNYVGGRTRAILVDKNDPSHKTIFSGSVSGGLWKTTDVTAADAKWTKVNEWMQNLAIGAIAQDPTHPNNIYVGTGEFTGDVDGLGIFKSGDGGNTFSLLSSTTSGNFRYTQSMVVAPNGDVYAGTSSGLYKSTDGGQNWSNVLSSYIHDVELGSDGTFFVGTKNTVYRSTTGNAGSWTNLNSKPGFPTGFQRAELSICASNPQVVYLVGSLSDPMGEVGSNIYITVDGGNTWTKKANPDNGNWAANQAWYDLDIAADPNNPDRVWVGGLNLYVSGNKGGTWTKASDWAGGQPQYVHADQHVIVFEEGNSNVIYFGNDGGFWRTDNGTVSVPAITDRNLGYNVTQFYFCAMHPDTFSNYFIAGAQDNGTQLINGDGLDNGNEILGGDGFSCHIDQNEPNIQITSLYNGDYHVSKDGGASFPGGADAMGGFYSISDYDNTSNILFAQTDNGDFFRYKVNTSEPQVCQVTNMVNTGISTIYCDPNTPNRMYLGTYSGRIYRINNADQGDSFVGEGLATLQGTISSIDIEMGNPDHLLVTISNYGLPNNIYESTNGGANWTGVEGTSVANNLPDVPVRWGLFNPKDNKQAIIATEVGVWTTPLLQGANTHWYPPVPGKGIPLVRTDMLQVRTSDRLVLAGTYGRGMWTTDVFSDPFAKMVFDRVHYTNSELAFIGSRSLGADLFHWNFGDNITSNEDNPTHSYPNIGTYDVALTINDTITTHGAVKILPDRLTPYTPQSATYGGDFEGNTDDYGVYTLNGSSFERGKSTIPYKDGVHGGTNAYVLGLTEQYYKPNTETRLYLPNFDMSEAGIYEFSFWGKWKIDPGKDGLMVQYSTDRGLTWQQLGTELDEWYNFSNSTLTNAAFPKGSAYFTKSVSEFTKYRLNISQLAGNHNVAFRFVFKSEGTGNFPGLAIDDVQLTKYDGELQTKVTQFQGAYEGSYINIDWATSPEYNCRNFVLELSENGFTFDTVTVVNALGVNSADEHTYTMSQFPALKVPAPRNLYFFRLHVLNRNDDFGYLNEFDTPVIVVSREAQGLDVYKVAPTILKDHVDVAFTGLVNGPVTFDLFNEAGSQVFSIKKVLTDEVFTRLDLPAYLDFPKGIYFLRISANNKALKTVKVFGD